MSDLLAASVEGDDEALSVGELSRRLSARGLAPVVLAMGLLNIVTIIPGSSTVMGLPLVFLGISLMIGARSLWLPRRIRDHVIPRARLASAIERILPYVRRLERLAHPRLWPGYDSLLDRVFGAFVFCLALLIALPIPFGNTMPALAVILTSLGFMARDGLWVVAGVFVATLALGIVIGVAGALALAGSTVLGL
ncbi:MAG: exopolysaccharide biosynthesis protein [Paracoccaceae bacterium]